MANSPSEDTTCLNMKRDFNSFLSGTGPRRPGATKHGLHFSLDESHQSKNGQQHSTSISVRSLLDKDRQDKLKEAEIISANTRISELKSQISHLETAHKKAKIEHEKEMGIVQQESQNEIHRLSEYKERWQYLIDKETETQEQCTIIRKQLDTCKTSYEQKLCKLQKEKLQLEEDLQQSEEGKQAKELEMKNEIWRQKTELDICKNELDETRERLKLQLKRSSEVTAQLQEMEEYKMRAVNAERKIKDLEDEVRRFEEDSVLVKAMKSQLASLPDLEREIRTLKDKNNHLRATQENVALIEEEMISLRSRLERADQRCAEMAKIQVQNDELKLKIQQWEVTTGDDGRKISPVELKQRLAEAQSAQLASLEKEGQLQSRIRSLEDSLKSRGEQQSAVSSRLTQETSRTVQQTDMIRRLQKKVLIIAKERDAFKRILDSYESEMTVNLEAHAGSRLQAQDESLSGYRKQVETLEEELQKKSEQLTQETTRAQQLELRLQEVVSRTTPVEENQKSARELRVSVAELESKLQTVQEEKFVLEARIEQRHLQGDFDPMKTKVVHFRNNPAALAQKQRGEELVRLRAENDRLRERVKLLETSGGQLEDLTVLVEKNVQENPAQSLDDLKAQVSTAELKNQRLIEAFKKTSQEFREICYLLTGYKIDIYQTKQYRLTNMYAESPDDCLLFKQSSSGDVQLLETNYAATLQGLMEVYLQKQDSIPGLLSALTLELLSHQTIKQ